jgi:HPr kinase/phosphorylase
MAGPDPVTLHATAVAFEDCAALIVGASGAGKSALALEMMARGATLVADDQVILRLENDCVMLSCPDTLCGMIEARDVGILYAAYRSSVPLSLVIDMNHEETVRLPEHRTITYLTKTFPLLHNVKSKHFPAAILQYLRHEGRADA